MGVSICGEEIVEDLTLCIGHKTIHLGPLELKITNNEELKMPATSHGLGIGNGSLIENTDTGTVQYRATGKLLPAFNLRLADVTGVSGQSKGFLKVLIKVHGQGTVLAEVEVNHGTTELVAEWFKSRIGLGATRGVATDGPGVTEELTRLAAFRRDGILSEEEFVAAKRKLVGLG